MPRMSRKVRSSASKAFLWAIVHSSQIIILQLLSSFPSPKFLVILHIGESEDARSNGNLRAEWAVLPPGKSVAAIPEDVRQGRYCCLFLFRPKIG